MIIIFDTFRKKLDRITGRIDTHIPDRLRTASEYYYICVLCVFLVLFSFFNTKIYLTFPARSGVLLMPFALLAVILQFASHIRDNLKILFSILLVAVYSLVFIFNRTEHGNYGYLVLLGFMTAGCIGIHYRKILKIWCICVGCMIMFTFISASVGAAENLVYYVGGTRLQIRGSLGVIFPTDCATWVLFFLMMLWIADIGIPEWVMVILSAVSAVFARKYCDSNTSFFCSLLLIMIIIFYSLEKKYLSLLKPYLPVKRILNVIIMGIVPVSSIFMLLLAVLYGKGVGIAHRLDVVLHGRISLSWNAIETYGITLFGTNFEMIGNGSPLIPDKIKYNFLDCSYINILIRYGIIIFILVIGMWIFIGIRTIKNNDRRLLFVMALISIHSVEEHHFIEAIYNPVTMMALSNFSFQPESGKEHTEEKTPKNIAILVGLLITVIYALFLPCIFSLMKTVNDLTRDESGIPDMKVFILMTLILLSSFIAIEFGVINLVKHISSKKQFDISRKHIISIISGTFLLSALLAGCTIAIKFGDPAQATRIESDREALAHILAVNEYPVYCDFCSEIYRDEFPEIRRSIFSGADLARYKRATVLMDKSSNTKCFFERGYLFSQISDKTIVYTRDEVVMKELERAGYHITGYYSSSRKAEKEGDDLTTDVLFNGRYRFSAEIKLLNTVPKSEEEVGEVRISPLEKEEPCGVETLYLSDFKDGIAHKDIICLIDPSSAGAKISVRSGKNFDIELISASYIMEPDMDIHDHYNDRYQVIRSEFYDLDGHRISAKDGASALEYEYDEAGNQSVVRYYGIDDRPVIVGSGYAEVHRVYDDMRHIVAESYFGVDGMPKALGTGQASDEREYDGSGNIIVQRYYGTDGMPVMLKAGYSEIHRAFNEDNRVIREEYYGTDGTPVTLTGKYAAIEYGYDEDGNTILIRYSRMDGTPALTSSWYSEIRRKYDEYGRMLEESYYDTDGVPVIANSGYASIRKEYDSLGRVAQERYLDTNGEPVTLPSGQAYDTRSYDSNGNCVDQKYYDASGNPVIINAGYAEIGRDYNDKKQLLAEHFFGTSGRPIALKAGYASVLYEYDESGNQCDVRYLDPDDNPVMISSGYSEITRSFDGKKRQVKEEYKNLQGDPAVSLKGYSTLEREYDDADRIVKESYIGRSGKSVNTTSGYASVENTYDENGRLSEKRYYDANGHLSADSDSKIAKIRYGYDETGNIVSEDYFGSDGQSACNNRGYAKVAISYDVDGREISRRYYGDNGKPVAIDSGYAEIRYDRSSAGRVTAEWYYDAKGQPVTCTEGYYGIKREYNEKGVVASQTFVDDDGNPMTSASLYAKTDTEYDDCGQAICIKYYDINDNPATTINGYSELRREYDVWGRLIKEEYFDKNGNPVCNDSLIAGYEREYDSRDLVIRETYFDKMGNETENAIGISELLKEYDDTGYLIRDEKGNTSGTIQESIGYAGILCEYDDKGLRIHEEYVDETGAPVIVADLGYAMTEYSYDDLRKKIEQRFLDTKGNIMVTDNGYAGVTTEYDGRTVIAESYLDTDGSLTDSSDGYCITQRDYDEDRNLISVTYKNRSGKPSINNSVGYATVKYEYDDVRNRTAEYYYDAGGSPICDVDGVASVRYTYDKYRNRTEEHLDVTGSPVES